MCQFPRISTSLGTGILKNTKMKNSETEIVKKMQKPPIIKNFKNNKNSKNNALHEKDLKENSDNIMIKIYKTKQPSTSDNEENLSSSEQEDEMYTDIDDSQSEEEISDNSSSSFETDSDSESAEHNSDEIGDITLKRYINSQVDGIHNDEDENVDEEEDFEYDEEGDDGVDDDDDDDEAYDEGCLDDFLNEISYNYMLSDELYNHEIYSDLDQDEPSYSDVVITEMNDDMIKEVESWQENDAKSEEDCTEAVNYRAEQIN